jgi:SAM-dependent methyltransferase
LNKHTWTRAGNDRKIGLSIDQFCDPAPAGTGFLMTQAALWSYFQNERGESFSGAETRLKALLRIAGREGRGGRLLNVGAGNGFLELEARRRGFQVVAVDPDERTCSRLVSLGIDARVGLIEKIPVEESDFDIVVATEVLEHLTVATFQAGLAEIKRVLKPQGRFVGTVPYREKLESNLAVCPDCHKVFHRWGHQQSFSVESLRTGLAGLFAVEECRPVLYPPWNILNWRGRAEAWLAVLLSRMGIYGSGAKILFVCRQSIASGAGSR